MTRLAPLQWKRCQGRPEAKTSVPLYARPNARGVNNRHRFSPEHSAAQHVDIHRIHGTRGIATLSWPKMVSVTIPGPVDVTSESGTLDMDILTNPRKAVLASLT